MGEASAQNLATPQDILQGLERLLGPRVMLALKEILHYTYFGTDDVEYIMQTRPELFERAMSEIFGKAWPMIFGVTLTSARE